MVSCKEKEDDDDKDSKKSEVKKEETPTMPDSATMMKNWMAYMTPGDMHAMIAKSNGTWDGETTMWMAPDAPPTISKSVAVNKMVLGGRYQVSEHKGEFSGMPFEGMATLAFDNTKKVFISTWIDNMGSGIMKLEGPWDAASKSITLTGKVVDCMMGGETNMREVFKMVDDDHQVLEMYSATPDGKGEFKTMEIKYTRKK